MNLDDFYTAQEVADRFGGVTLKTVYQWAKGGLESELYRGMRYFRKEAVLSFQPPRGRYRKSRR